MNAYVAGCGIFIAVLILGLLGTMAFGGKAERALAQIMVWTAVACCWSLWSIFYFAQLHPLVLPELED